MCFFTRAKISNKVSDKLLQTLYNIYPFIFVYNPIIYTYKEDKLNALVNALIMMFKIRIECFIGLLQSL